MAPYCWSLFRSLCDPLNAACVRTPLPIRFLKVAKNIIAKLGRSVCTWRRRIAYWQRGTAQTFALFYLGKICVAQHRIWCLAGLVSLAPSQLLQGPGITHRIAVTIIV